MNEERGRVWGSSSITVFVKKKRKKKRAAVLPCVTEKESDM